MERSCAHFTSFPPVVTSCTTVAQFHQQDIDLDTIHRACPDLPDSHVLVCGSLCLCVCVVSVSVCGSVWPVSFHREESEARVKALPRTGQWGSAELGSKSRHSDSTSLNYSRGKKKSHLLFAAVHRLGNLTGLCCSCELKAWAG